MSKRLTKKQTLAFFEKSKKLKKRSKLKRQIAEMSKSFRDKIEAERKLPLSTRFPNYGIKD